MINVIETKVGTDIALEEWEFPNGSQFRAYGLPHCATLGTGYTAEQAINALRMKRGY